jgi:hypothetical protein
MDRMIEIAVPLLIVAGIAAFLLYNVYQRSQKKKAVPGVLPPITGATPATPPIIQPRQDVVNPFIAWKAAGVTLYDIMTHPKYRHERYGRQGGLTEAEIAQAAQAGYKVANEPVPGGSADRSGPDLNGGVVRVNSGASYTYSFDVPADRPRAELVFMTESGSNFSGGSYSLSGPLSRSGALEVSGSSSRSKPIDGEVLPSGHYQISISLANFLGVNHAAQLVLNT